MIEYIDEISGIPKVIGPYSPAVRAGNLLFISGQIPIDPLSGKLAGDNIETQTRQVLSNLKTLLKSQALSFKNVAKTTIFLTNMADFKLVNTIYEKEMEGARPARSTVQVADLPLGAKIEIEMIAARD